MLTLRDEVRALLGPSVPERSVAAAVAYLENKHQPGTPVEVIEADARKAMERGDVRRGHELFLEASNLDELEHAQRAADRSNHGPLAQLARRLRDEGRDGPELVAFLGVDERELPELLCVGSVPSSDEASARSALRERAGGPGAGPSQPRHRRRDPQ